MHAKRLCTILLAVSLTMICSAAWSAGECVWRKPAEVENRCKTRCEGHSNPQACKAKCPEAVVYYKPWTEKACNYVTRGQCVGDIGNHQNQQTDPAAKVAYGFISFHGCLGNP